MDLTEQQKAAQAAYLAKLRTARAEKEALIVPGSRWRHQQNKNLCGTVVRTGSVTQQNEDRLRVWLMLDGTAEEYRCPPQQLVDAWDHLAPPPAPKPEPKPEPKPDPTPDTEPSPASPPAPKPSRKKKASKRKSRRS